MPVQDLFNACHVGDVDAVKSLFGRYQGAGLTELLVYKDERGWTPIYMAARSGVPELIALLAAAGADVNIANDV